jgi:MtaA/CmuA family methyltransferase
MTGSMTGRERVAAAIRGEPVDHLPHIPISMMIAAEAIGEPYGKYVLEAEVHARGQVEFAGRWDVDNVSVVSCPTTEAADLGASIIYFPDQPPAVDEEHALLLDKAVLAGLKVPDPGSGRRMAKRLEVVRLLKERVGGEKLVEGWVEGPMAEAADLRGINAIMIDLIDDPGFVQDLFAFVYENAMSFARAQVKAGADIIGVGDAAASLIGPELYRDAVLSWEKKYIETIHAMGALVRLHICGNTNSLFPFLREVKADIVDLDSMAEIAGARREIGAGSLLSGNIDPVRVLKFGSPEAVREGLEGCLSDAGGRSYAACAGCEVPRGTPHENLAAMRDFARSHRW